MALVMTDICWLYENNIVANAEKNCIYGKYVQKYYNLEICILPVNLLCLITDLCFAFDSYHCVSSVSV